MFTNPNNLVKVLKNLIQSEMRLLKPIEIYKVTGVDEVNFTVNVRHLNWKSIEYTNVRIASVGLGDQKGMMKLPGVDDLVVIAFLGGTSSQPIVLGTLFDSYTQSPDGIPQIKENEFYVTNKGLGSFMLIKEDNSIDFRVADADGNLTGAKLRLSPDGSFKLFNKDNYGIECDASGNIKLRGVTVDATQTPGTF